MTKKFVIKPWVIIVISVLVIGGGVTFFILKNGSNNNSTPTQKQANIAKTTYADYMIKTNKKIADAKAQEVQCRSQINPETKKNYTDCAELEQVKMNNEKKELEKAEVDKKVKQVKATGQNLSPARLEAIRRQARKDAAKLVQKKRRASFPRGCMAFGKKGDKNQNDYTMLTTGCKKCKDGYFLDESGDCHEMGTAECNDPYHFADKDGKILNDAVLIKKYGVKCICPHINPGTNNMHQYSDGKCLRKYNTKKGIKFLDHSRDSNDIPYPATNQDKKAAVASGKLHPSTLKNPSFYQDESQKAMDKESADQENKNLFLKIENADVGKYYKEDVNKKIIETTKSDKDPTVFYKPVDSALYVCYPNKPLKGQSSLCSGNLHTGHIGKQGFVITPECVF